MVRGFVNQVEIGEEVRVFFVEHLMQEAVIRRRRRRRC